MFKYYWAEVFLLIFNKELLQREQGPIKELIPLCRKTAAEGSVLLKNDNNLLPFEEKTKIYL